MIKCQLCWKTLRVKKGELPGEFLSDALVDVRDQGGLKRASINLFKTISIVENILDKHFSTAQRYIRDSFEEVMSKLTLQVFPPICCHTHRSELVPKLIYEFVVIRFRFKGKHYTNSELSKAAAKRHSNRKQSKL